MEKYTIIGAGGIGCAVGYALQAAGAAVQYVEADHAKAAWGRRHGVQVDHLPPLPVEMQTFADWQPDPQTTLLLCTKCYDNAAVLDRIPRGVMILPIQNGFDRLLDSLGHSLEGIASFVSECSPHQTRTRITRGGKIHLGHRSCSRGDPDEAQKLENLGGLLGRCAFFRLVVVANISPYKHSKLMYNAAIGPIAAVAGLDNGQLLGLPQARRLFFDLLKENYGILRGAGIPLGKVGPFHPDTVNRILHRSLVARLLSWAFYPSLRGTYCSMNGDLPLGRTEIDYYNGYLIELAGDRPCPLNRRVHELVKRMERDRLEPKLAMLENLAA